MCRSSGAFRPMLRASEFPWISAKWIISCYVLFSWTCYRREANCYARLSLRIDEIAVLRLKHRPRHPGVLLRISSSGMMEGKGGDSSASITYIAKKLAPPSRSSADSRAGWTGRGEGLSSWHDDVHSLELEDRTARFHNTPDLPNLTSKVSTMHGDPRRSISIMGSVDARLGPSVGPEIDSSPSLQRRTIRLGY